MTQETRDQRWAVMLVQAERFAEKEAFTEAVARASVVVREVEAALEEAPGLREAGRLRRILTRAEKAVAHHREQWDAWTAAIAKRRAATVASAEAEMKRPLPRF